MYRKTYIVLTLLCAQTAFAQDEQPASSPAVMVSGGPDAPGGVDEYSALPYEGTSQSKFQIYFHGYARTRFAWTTADDAAPFVGRNNGFSMAHARLETTAGYANKLWLKLAIEGAFDRSFGFSGAVAQTAAGQVVMAMRDAYVAYQPFQWLRFSVGQFRAPFDREALWSTAKLTFISRSVESVGVRATDGYFVAGLSPDREIGASISGHDIALSERVRLSYYAAVVNGNGPNMNANDNNSVGVFGRLELKVPYVEIGAAGQWNPTTSGSFPNLFDETRAGGTADVKFDIAGFELFGQFMLLNSTYRSTGAPAINAMGAHGQVSYKFWFGLEPAYRAAWYEPNDRLAGDALLYHTFGLNYELPWVPVRVQANYTLTGEQGGRALKNNVFEALASAVF